MRVQLVLIPNENACVHLHLNLCALMNINSSYCRVLVQKLRARAGRSVRARVCSCIARSAARGGSAQPFSLKTVHQ